MAKSIEQSPAGTPPDGVRLPFLAVIHAVITLLIIGEFVLLQAVAAGVTTVVYLLIPTLDAAAQPSFENWRQIFQIVGPTVTVSGGAGIVLSSIIFHWQAQKERQRAEAIRLEAQAEVQAAREGAQAEVQAAREGAQAEVQAAREEAQAEVQAAREESQAARAAAQAAHATAQAAQAVAQEAQAAAQEAQAETIAALRAEISRMSERLERLEQNGTNGNQASA